MISRFLKAFAAPWSLLILGLGAGGGWLLGAAWPVVLGAVLSATLAARRAASGPARALDAVTAALEPPARQALEQLRDDLAKMARTPGLERIASRALEQLDLAHGKFVDFGDMLSSRFSSTELTHGRYLGSGEQVYLSVLDGLGQARTALQAAASVDPDYLRAGLRRLRRIENPSVDEARELSSLEERQRTRDEQLTRAGAALAGNEEALTRLTGATAALAGIETRRGLAALDGDQAMRDLEHLAQRAERYAVGGER